jgi:hypothetical protein
MPRPLRRYPAQRALHQWLREGAARALFWCPETAGRWRAPLAQVHPEAVERRQFLVEQGAIIRGREVRALSRRAAQRAKHPEHRNGKRRARPRLFRRAGRRLDVPRRLPRGAGEGAAYAHDGGGFETFLQEGVRALFGTAQPCRVVDRFPRSA